MAITADDGLLLNFDLNVGAIKSKPIFKGGKWKDRLIAKRGIRHREKKIASGVNAVATKERARTGILNEDKIDGQTNGQSNEQIGDVDQVNHTPAPPSKRPRLMSNATPSSVLKPSTEITSSLFTSNPTPKSVSTTNATQSAPLPPSNAPLPSSLTKSFTALGLSPTLA